MSTTSVVSPGVAEVEVAQVAESEPAHAQSTYGQILKSTALVGGSSVVNIAVGIIRTKLTAVLLGPTGVGLMGLFNAIADLAQSVVGVGLQNSGVRQVAEAVGSGDHDRLAQTVVVIRRASTALGVVGAVLLILLSGPISVLTFGTREHVLGIAVMAVAVCLRVIAAAQGAVIQGMRRVRDLAEMTVVAAFFSTVSSLPLLYLFRERAIAPSLLVVAVVSLLVAWWYGRKDGDWAAAANMSVRQTVRGSADLFKLGLAFMASGLLMMGSAYAVRVILLRQVGFEATGLYQAAWTLGGLYVGFILQAMGTDFYPRLTAAADDHATCNRLVNEQARVGMLLGGPGAIATLTFAPVVIAVFYTANFRGAVEVLRWICLGVALRVFIWPMGFIILAKGKQRIYFWTELAWALVNVSLTWVCVRAFGVTGAGIAFFASYVFYGLMMYPVVAGVSGFRWSRENLRTALLFLSLTTLVFVGCYVLPLAWAAPLGTVVAIASGVYSLRALLRIVSWERIPAPIGRMLVTAGLAPKAANR